MAKEWSEAKRKRWLATGGRCEVCRQSFSLRECVAHHRKNRSQHGPSTYANLELRCRTCEAYMHATYRFGNAPHTQRPLYTAPTAQVLMNWREMSHAQPYREERP